MVRSHHVPDVQMNTQGELSINKHGREDKLIFSG